MTHQYFWYIYYLLHICTYYTQCHIIYVLTTSQMIHRHFSSPLSNLLRTWIMLLSTRNTINELIRLNEWKRQKQARKNWISQGVVCSLNQYTYTTILLFLHTTTLYYNTYYIYKWNKKRPFAFLPTSINLSYV